MATNNKLTKSLRNSIAAETKSIDLLHGLDTPQTKQATKTSTAKPKTKVALATKKSAKKRVLAKKTASQAAKQKIKSSAKAAIKKTTSTSSAKTHPATKLLQDNMMVGLAHNKLHHLVETNYHICETCLENLQRVNNNLHDYLNQLVEVNNVGSLIKLNLSYLSAVPTRCQEMIAQNKNIFSKFFEFAKPMA